jgi:hypothetical protein
MKVYTVLWGTGSCDDHYNAHAFANVHGTYKSEASALKALEDCKQEIYDETLTDLDPDGELPNVEDEVQIYGSVKERYFAIDYTLGTEPVEIYITMVETEIQE